MRKFWYWLFVFDACVFGVGLLAWIYDEIAYGHQPIYMPFEFLVFVAFFIWCAKSEGKRLAAS